MGVGPNVTEKNGIEHNLVNSTIIVCDYVRFCVNSVNFNLINVQFEDYVLFWSIRENKIILRYILYEKPLIPFGKCCLNILQQFMVDYVKLCITLVDSVHYVVFCLNMFFSVQTRP